MIDKILDNIPYGVGTAFISFLISYIVVTYNGLEGIWSIVIILTAVGFIIGMFFGKKGLDLAIKIIKEL